MAKVEALTQQLEDLRRDRKCSIGINLNGKNSYNSDASNKSNGTNNSQLTPSPAVRELEKLRRELVVSVFLYYIILFNTSLYKHILYFNFNNLFYN